jgi:hypothetical protein
MNYDFIFILALLTTTIIILGFIAPTIGLAIAVMWTAYGITRIIQTLANRDNVI